MGFSCLKNGSGDYSGDLLQVSARYRGETVYVQKSPQSRQELF
jgi:hypothetical protein